MKNLIYQYWDGKLRPSAKAGADNLKRYAKRIGAEHIFEHNANWAIRRGLNLNPYTAHYGEFKVVYDEQFQDYDHILFCDTDIFAKEDCSENIFEELDGEHIGLCREKFQESQRKISLGRITSEGDERWAKVLKDWYRTDIPRNENGDLKVYNSGVVLWSREGLDHAKKTLKPMDEYCRLIQSSGLNSFYYGDQNYLHAMVFACKMKLKELDDGWNSYIHFTHDKYQPEKRMVDNRTENTKLVHIQFSGADNLDADTHHRITNLPQSEWNLP